MKIKKDDLTNKQISVVGISGMEGWAATQFLLDKGAKVIAHDFANKKEFKDNFFNLRDYLSNEEKKEEWQKFKDLKIELKLKDDYLKDIEKSDYVFLPQSWFRYSFNKKIKKLKDKLKIITILDLYFSFSPAKIVAITGSSGKSTTSKMIEEIFKEEKKALLSGNDRENPPVLDKLNKLSQDDYLILEVSNRQLIDFDHGPDIGLITTIFPTHMDDHKDLAAYKYVKQNLIRNQSQKQATILNYDDSDVMDLELASSKSEVYYYSLLKKPPRGAYIKDGFAYWSSKEEKIVDMAKLKVPGRHNQANALGAIVAAKVAGISKQAIKKGLYRFKGLPHRIEFVKKIEGVSYYEDSQSTNPLSTVAALKSFDRPLILIAGGKNKPNQSDFDIMAEEIMENDNIKSILLIGQSSKQIIEVIKDFSSESEFKKLNIKSFANLKKAMEGAKKRAKKGEVVILSPACESFGEFKDYRERGEKFKQLVKDD